MEECGLDSSGLEEDKSGKEICNLLASQEAVYFDFIRHL
jgi:hypothetical protein